MLLLLNAAYKPSFRQMLFRGCRSFTKDDLIHNFFLKRYELNASIPGAAVPSLYAQRYRVANRNA